MNTKFLFALPVVAMIAMTTTVANAAGCKAEVNKVVNAEVASVNKVDVEAGVKATAVAKRIYGPCPNMCGYTA